METRQSTPRRSNKKKRPGAEQSATWAFVLEWCKHQGKHEILTHWGAALKVVESDPLIESCRISTHMIMAFFDIYTDGERMIALCQAPQQLTAQVVCFLLHNLIWMEESSLLS